MNDSKNAIPGAMRTRFRILSASLLAAALCSACSTYTVSVHATPGETMNPNRTGGSSALNVYAFFLKKTDAFEAKDKVLASYLDDGVMKDNKVPAWLEQEATGVQRIEVPCPTPGKTATVTKKFEVPVEVTHVGLIAAFQSHRDNDPEEKWRLVLPVEGSAVSFDVKGRCLAVPEPKKEAPRATTADG